MSKLRLAVVVRAHRELRLTAGEAPLDDLDRPEFEHMVEEVQTPDGPASLRFGLARVGAVHLWGAEVVNPAYPQDSLRLSWYLPDEEGPEAARDIPLASVGLIPEPHPRPPAEAGHVWRFRVEGWGPVEQTHVFQSGFQPPLKPSELTLRLTSLKNFGFDSLILGQILHLHRAPAYIEGDMGVGGLIAEGLLEG
jgi:hypothetical protein